MTDSPYQWSNAGARRQYQITEWWEIVTKKCEKGGLKYFS